MPSNLVWVDCEMTGLDLEKDEIVEIAVIVTDSDLNQLDKGLQLVIKPSESALANMGEFVTKMHEKSGLLPELENGITLQEADQQVTEYIKQFVEEPRTAPLCGNSIGTDRMFINRQMPELDSFLHYRNIDVSSLKELSRRWFPEVYQQQPKKAGNHRALADIQESIIELRYYRQVVLVETPGPKAEVAKAVAKALQADTI